MVREVAVVISLLRREMDPFSTSNRCQEEERGWDLLGFVGFYLQGSRDKRQLFRRDAIGAPGDTHP